MARLTRPVMLNQEYIYFGYDRPCKNKYLYSYTLEEVIMIQS